METAPTSTVLGIDGPVSRRRVMVRGGNKSAGDVVMFDLPAGDAATTDYAIGSTNSALVNVVTPVSGQLTHGLFGVMQADATDDNPGYITLEGFCTAYLIKSSGDISAGDMLVVDTSGNLTPDGAIGRKAVAWFAPLDGAAMSGPSTRTLGRVFFSGVNPIGVHAG
jgi:hypothetical protein